MYRDIGANLAGKHFTDIIDVINRAREAGIAFIDITGTSIASSREAISLAKQYPGFMGATAGVHPHSAKTLDAEALKSLEALVCAPEVLMCGEMGLDFARNFSTPQEQIYAFEAQLELAHKAGKPLFLHCREAFDKFVEIMDRHPQLWQKAIVHCFTGSAKEAQIIIERGGYIGVTGWITDSRRNHDLLEAVKVIPLDRLLVETDAPYLMPLNKPKSKPRDRNEPAYLPWVTRAIAAIIGEDEKVVAETTFANAKQLIGMERKQH